MTKFAWRSLAAGFYLLFAVLPAAVAALHGGTERGDVRRDALAFAEAYGSEMAAYVAGAPRASKLLELSALVVLPAALFVLVLGSRETCRSFRGLYRTAYGTTALVIFGHSVVFAAMLIGGGALDVAWSWMWRLAALTVVSAMAELGLIVFALTWLASKRRLAVVLLLGVALLGTVLRLYDFCAVPLLPGCVDASLLSGRLGQQAAGAVIASLWIALALVLIRQQHAAIPKAKRWQVATTSRGRLSR